MKFRNWVASILAPIFMALTLNAHAQVRIRDVVDVEGVRQNDLVGFGIVVGLNGTGDTVRNSPFTEDSLTHMLERLGVNVQGEQIRPENVAAVLVTASLPAFARQGSTIDVTISSIGDASSLEGGMLIMTPLKGADNNVYAVAQGSVIVSGINVQAEGASARKGTPTSGAVPNGARVEREIPYEFNDRGQLTLALRNADFTTATRIEDTINAAYGMPVAYTRDPGTVEVNIAALGTSPARAIATIENLPVKVALPARIVIDEKSGTIVLGEDVTISRVAIAQGDISIRVQEYPVASQPNPFSQGESIVLPRSEIYVDEQSGGTQSMTILEPNVTLSQLIEGLNSLGVTPTEMADIIRAIDAAGAIQAELIVR